MENYKQINNYVFIYFILQYYGLVIFVKVESQVTAIEREINQAISYACFFVLKKKIIFVITAVYR